jgi:branched-chain amino acid transport system permease protein
MHVLGFDGVKQVFYGVCLLIVVMALPDGIWPGGAAARAERRS